MLPEAHASVNHSPHVLLIFPPQAIPLSPYLSTPSLAAYLKGSQVSVSQRDLNLDFYDTLLSEECLLPMCQELDQLFQTLDGRPSLHPDEQKYYYSIYLLRNLLAALPARIEEAKSFLRDRNRFFDLNELRWHQSLLNAALNVINIYSTVQLSFDDLVFPIDIESYADIANLILNRGDTFLIALFRKQIENALSSTAPHLVGFSVTYSSQLVPAMVMANWIRANRPEIHVTLGGNILSRCVEGLRGLPDFFRHFADSVVLFEGERPLLKLIQALGNGKSLSTVPNLIYWDEEIIQTEVLPPEEIDTLPTPDFHGLSLDRYFSPYPILPVLGSRGCYWGQCAFCDHGRIYRGRFQQRDAALVVRDLQALGSEYDTKCFSFSDECLSPTAARRISTIIVEEGIDVSLFANARLESAFSDELCKLMACAGFKMVLIGLESACERTLKTISKGIDIAGGAEILHRLHNAGILAHLFVIFGLPGETTSEAERTFGFVLENKDAIFSVGAGVLGVGRFSPIGLNPSDYGVVLHPVPPTKPFAYDFEFDYLSEQSSAEALDLCERFREFARTELPSGRIWSGLFREQSFLYALRYSEDELSAIAQRFEGSQADSQHLIAELAGASSELYPSLRRGVHISKLGFDILDIQAKLENDSRESVEREPGYFVCSLDKKTSARVTPDGHAILLFCNGNISMDAIVDELAGLYTAGRSELEQKAVAFISEMTERGYVQILREPKIVLEMKIS